MNFFNISSNKDYIIKQNKLNYFDFIELKENIIKEMIKKGILKFNDELIEKINNLIKIYSLNNKKIENYVDYDVNNEICIIIYLLVDIIIHNIKSYKKSKKRHINEEIILDLMINNKIIIKNELFNRLISLYHNLPTNESFTFLVKIIYFIWYLKDIKLYEILKKIEYKTELECALIKGISMNYSIILYCIKYIYLLI